MEELALSHILNAEGEKLQYILETLLGTNPHNWPQNVQTVNKKCGRSCRGGHPEPDAAEKQAGHFLDSRTAQIDMLSKFMDVPPVVVCPYDAELYGHWWYEGPYWLYILFKKI